MMWLYLVVTSQLLLSGGWVITVQSQDRVSRPLSHSLPPQRGSMFGSRADGRCMSVSNNICNGTSVLNDGIIPALSGVSDSPSSQWAAELFTMTRSGTEDITLTFEVDDVSHDRVELAVFNCPERGIYAPQVKVHLANSDGVSLLLVANQSLTNTSCDYLLNFCVEFPVRTVTHYNIIFPYENNSNSVFLGEVTFVNFIEDVACDTPELITSPVTLPTSTTSESPTNGDTDPTMSDLTTSPGSPTTPDSSTSAQPIRNSATIIAIVVVLILLALVITLTVILVMVLMYMRKRKRQQDHDKVQQLQSVVMETKEGAKGDKDLSDNQYDTVDRPPQNGLQTTVGSGVAITNALYSVPDEERNDTYNRLRNGEKRETTPLNVSGGEDQYSKLNQNCQDSPANARLSPAPQSRPVDEGDMYAVPDKKRRAESSPAVPQKSSELTEYLYAKEVRHDKEAILQNSPPEYSEINRRNGSTGSVPLSNQGSQQVSGMSSNPLYHPTDVRPLHTMPLKSTQSGGVGLEVNPIYAEPQAPNVHEPKWNPDQNIYESIYSEALSPSLFMQEREVEDVEDLCPYSSIYAPPIVPLIDKPLSVSVGNIKEIKHLGNGNFGEVVLAKTVGLKPKDLRLDSEAPYTLVAVKKLKPSASMRNRESFDKEVKFMSRLNHPNVIRLLAVCNEEAAPFIMMEYMTNGDLNQYLNGFHSIVDGSSDEGKSISSSRLVYISTQIASAMQYLASQNFVHRDLATRNCLVGSKDTIKISDFGMSRSLYESSYYVISGHAILPIRWMATECFYGKFSAKTDVWAFGVTMWEIFTLAKDPPFNDLEDREVVEDAVKGSVRRHLEKPPSCPERIYSIMKKCWVHQASQRATFDELYELLSSS